MRIFIFISFLLVSLLFKTQEGYGQRVKPCDIYGVAFEVDHPSKADFIVYEEESEAFADLVVFEEDNQLYADRKGIWFFTKTPSLAHFFVFFTDQRSKADFSVYFTETESFAGCR